MPCEDADTLGELCGTTEVGTGVMTYRAKECQRWAATARSWERQGKSSPGASDGAFSAREDVSITWKHPVYGTLLPQPQETRTRILFKDMKVITQKDFEKGWEGWMLPLGSRPGGEEEQRKGRNFSLNAFRTIWLFAIHMCYFDLKKV